ncbi:hypothetical protein I553_10173 [Mycobacterium xenopi 4042]|uniref:Uncharacterized protein n=1 Tax=Mycobacterium xenopi 4042 TaxID=1299334 RepID=X7ZN18_MYCXE|nr:hypothetical protein I553_10173 [Mycobacterium xenopi 4042]
MIVGLGVQGYLLALRYLAAFTADLLRPRGRARSAPCQVRSTSAGWVVPLL